MHDVNTILVNGIMQRGYGGVAYVNYETDTQGYLFPDEFSNKEVAEGLKRAIRENEGVSWVVEERTTNGERNLHVLGCPTEEVVRNALERKRASQSEVIEEVSS